MHVYLRIFLACVPTQLVKAFGIKRLNIYCLVQSVSPAERKKRSRGRGGTLPNVIPRPLPSSLKLISALLSLCLQPQLALSFGAAQFPLRVHVRRGTVRVHITVP